MRYYPYPAEEARRDIVVSIILSLVTCGIYSLYWQYKQMETLNAWLGRDEYNFWMWLLLSIVTCGLYAIYIEYKMAKSITDIQQTEGLTVNTNLPLICLLLALFGLPIVSLAIQQNEIDAWYNS